MKTDLCFHPRQISKIEVEKSLPDIIDILKRHNISLAYLFGSILFEDTKAPDLDIAIYIKHPIKNIFDYYNDVYFDICDIFKADNIDLVILNNVSPLFRYDVIKTGRLIYYQTEEVIAEFIVDTLFKYEDIKPFNEEYRKELHKRAKEGLLMAERKINKEKIYGFIDNMNRSLDEIKSNLGDRDFIAFKEAKNIRELCVHYLRIALESVLDICRHIIAVKGLGIPDMEKENLIDVMGSNNIIPPGFAKKIRGMQGMRNAIVHVYWNLDYEKIYRMIRENISDFEDFARYIIEYLGKENN
ncbi:MAG: HepT-like ribonuclease domain-containing protein [Candidatus Aenigmatarchaeota archaeon]